MLRAYHLPSSLKLSPTSLCNFRFPLFALLRFTSPLNTPSLSKPFASISHSSSSLLSPNIRRTLSNGGGSTRSPTGRAFCSDGNSGKGEGREIMVQHLLLKEDNLKLLLELQQRIARGEDLSDLAVEYSICPSKEQGGMLGWVQKGRMVPEFEKAAFDAPLNKPVRCKTKFGWHILQVLSEREAALQDIEPEELHLKMQDPSFLEDAQLIDVREPEEMYTSLKFVKIYLDALKNLSNAYRISGHKPHEQASLPNFQVYPLRQFGSWSSEIITKLDPQKDTYVLCHHGVRSLQVAKWLQTQGFTRIFNVSGGIHAYAVKADPSVPTY